MRILVILYAMALSSISVFAQNSDNSCGVYISQPSFYGQFILEFIVVENGRIVSNPSFRIKYNKKKLKKIADKKFVLGILTQV